MWLSEAQAQGEREQEDLGPLWLFLELYKKTRLQVSTDLEALQFSTWYSIQASEMIQPV